MEELSRLIFRSAHGDRYLEARDSDSIVDVCRRYSLPVTQVSVYREGARGQLTLQVRPYDRLLDYRGDDMIVVIPNRNIDYHALLGGRDVVRERPDASTWIRQRADDGDGFVTEYLRPSDAMDLVSAQVATALEASGVKDEPLIVGVSGGGDSNALLEAIVRSGVVAKENIRPVMMLGIPDWDRGWERATAICDRHGLALRTVQEDETARILGFVEPHVDWVTAFERQFPGDDLEVLGVYGVRRVLDAVAQEQGARRIVIGSNLEDCLSDTLYYLAAGKVPFPKPVGRMGEVEILYPLWLTPKSLIDGCFPKFSLQNYEARYPSRMYGRAYFYYLAQMMVDAYPGAAQDLLRGSSRLAAEKFDELLNDDEFGTPVAAPIPLDVRVRLRRLFGRQAGGVR
ncbi:hypothetical protein [Cryobacterium sp. GrIS_2_6]|uniref:hypothetical protein n=1 Tax=Cryobacterium sp. GrIS_2_6 TaxID=3162785 RepID=UPI002DFB9368|nr:tRNA(Ile)-lysidine synthase TilS/MesJ [Cryobacterium psychrotolerans]